jgi:hypothetical protein
MHRHAVIHDAFTRRQRAEGAIAQQAVHGLRATHGLAPRMGEELGAGAVLLRGLSSTPERSSR